MFITKKKYQEEIEKAKKEAEEEMYKRQEMADRERWLYDRIDRLEYRLCKLENPPEPVHEKTCDPAAVRPACY